MAFRARKVFGTFEKQAPELQVIKCLLNYFNNHHEVPAHTSTLLLHHLKWTIQTCEAIKRPSKFIHKPWPKCYNHVLYIVTFIKITHIILEYKLKPWTELLEAWLSKKYQEKRGKTRGMMLSWRCWKGRKQRFDGFTEVLRRGRTNILRNTIAQYRSNTILNITNSWRRTRTFFKKWKLYCTTKVLR